MAAGKSPGKAARTSVSALRPPAEEASATTSIGCPPARVSSTASGPSTDVALTLYLHLTLREGGGVENAAGQQQLPDSGRALLGVSHLLVESLGEPAASPLARPGRQP